MQTFLPYPDFHDCAEALDNRRLNKQLVECQQILYVLLDPNKKGWANHPAVKMWRGYEAALCRYMYAMKNERTQRQMELGTWRKEHGSWSAIVEKFTNTHPHIFAISPEMPPWLGREDIHASHRANLIRKDPEFYGQFGWVEEPQDGYVWPV